MTLRNDLETDSPVRQGCVCWADVIFYCMVALLREARPLWCPVQLSLKNKRKDAKLKASGQTSSSSKNNSKKTRPTPLPERLGSIGQTAGGETGYISLEADKEKRARAWLRRRHAFVSGFRRSAEENINRTPTSKPLLRSSLGALF